MTPEVLKSSGDARPHVVIYTDGACSPNPGVGGWAAILISPQHRNLTRELSGAEPESTNNRMELTAALQALVALKRPCRVTLKTDSEYLRKAIVEGWVDRWQRNKWKTKARQPVANVDLWQQLLPLLEMHDVTFEWVRGHANNCLNNRCDELAVIARRQLVSRTTRP